MLLSIDDYGKHGLDPNDASLVDRLSVLEEIIRGETNNRFHVQIARVEAASSEGRLERGSRYWCVGDTVNVSLPESNEGLYVVKAIDHDSGYVSFDRPLFDELMNRVTLVRYPADVVAGAVGMLKYDERMVDKAGIASESLSRRSVSYLQPSDGNMYKGYPASITAFMRKYMKARF